MRDRSQDQSSEFYQRVVDEWNGLAEKHNLRRIVRRLSKKREKIARDCIKRYGWEFFEDLDLALNKRSHYFREVRRLPAFDQALGDTGLERLDEGNFDWTPKSHSRQSSFQNTDEETTITVVKRANRRRNQDSPRVD